MSAVWCPYICHFFQTKQRKKTKQNWRTWLIELRFYARPTWHRLHHFRRRSSQPFISWLGTEENKSNATKASNTGIKWTKPTQITRRILNLHKHTITKSKHKPTCKFNNCSMCVHVSLCTTDRRTQHSTEQFGLFSLLTFRQSSQLSFCFYFFLIFLFLCRALHKASRLVSFWGHISRPYRIIMI